MGNTLSGWDDVDPNESDDGDQTLLWCAAQNGYAEVVKILLRRGDVDLNEPDHADQTPLGYAATNGHERVVELLLEWAEVNPNTLDSRCRTPLWCAAQCSQSSGAPVGPGGGTAKSPGRDGTTKCRPSSSLNFQDGRH